MEQAAPANPVSTSALPSLPSTFRALFSTE